MQVRSLRRRMAVVVMFIMAVGSVQASSPNDYDVLIVTTNYVKSRMLAELIQYQGKHPVLLLPTGEEKDMMYALGPNGTAKEVHVDHYIEFVRNLQPKAVIFLGGPKYIDAEYVSRMEGRFPVVQIRTSDWLSIAETAGILLSLKKLKPTYATLLERLDGAGEPIPNVDPTRIFEPAKPQAEGEKTK